jgi:hypothetical protein
VRSIRSQLYLLNSKSEVTSQTRRSPSCCTHRLRAPGCTSNGGLLICTIRVCHKGGGGEVDGPKPMHGLTDTVWPDVLSSTSRPTLMTSGVGSPQATMAPAWQRRQLPRSPMVEIQQAGDHAWPGCEVEEHDGQQRPGEGEQVRGRRLSWTLRSVPTPWLRASFPLLRGAPRVSCRRTVRREWPVAGRRAARLDQVSYCGMARREWPAVARREMPLNDCTKMTELPLFKNKI